MTATLLLHDLANVSWVTFPHLLDRIYTKYNIPNHFNALEIIAKTLNSPESPSKDEAQKALKKYQIISSKYRDANKELKIPLHVLELTHYLI